MSAIKMIRSNNDELVFSGIKTQRVGEKLYKDKTGCSFGEDSYFGEFAEHIKNKLRRRRYIELESGCLMKREDTPLSLYFITTINAESITLEEMEIVTESIALYFRPIFKKNGCDFTYKLTDPECARHLYRGNNSYVIEFIPHNSRMF